MIERRRASAFPPAKMWCCGEERREALYRVGTRAWSRQGSVPQLPQPTVPASRGRMAELRRLMRGRRILRGHAQSTGCGHHLRRLSARPASCPCRAHHLGPQRRRHRHRLHLAHGPHVQRQCRHLCLRGSWCVQPAQPDWRGRAPGPASHGTAPVESRRGQASR
eukprot:scaffold92361_cov66-Phaeocystis_antarctica.AAC.3